MDNEPVSSSEMTPATSSDDALQDLELPICESLKCYAEERDICHEEILNAIDLENVSTTDTSDDEEEDISEQLSTDIQQPTHKLVLDTESSNDCKKELTSVLRERTQRLQLEMTSLREELARETALWQKEKEEFQFLRERSNALAFEEATSAARAAAAAYAVESPLSNDLSQIVDITSEQSVRNLAILEHEKNLAKYQDPYFMEQAERRYNAYKRSLVDAYRHKLLEVERLCNEELEKIRENTNYLQSFKEIASQWSMDENDHGDTSSRKCNDYVDTERSKIAETNFAGNNWGFKLGKVEVNVSSEILSACLAHESRI